MTIPTHGGRAVAAEPKGEAHATAPRRTTRLEACATAPSQRDAAARPRPPFRLLAVVALLAVLALAVSACGTASDTSAGQPRELSVFAAASLTDAFTRLGSDFTAAHPDVKVTFNFAGSNDLVTQVQQGAPADVLATADTSSMDKAGDLDRAVDRVRGQQAHHRGRAWQPREHHRARRPGPQGPQGRAGGAGGARRQVRRGGPRQGRRDGGARLPGGLRQGRRHQGLPRRGRRRASSTSPTSRRRRASSRESRSPTART